MVCQCWQNVLFIITPGYATLEIKMLICCSSSQYLWFKTFPCASSFPLSRTFSFVCCFFFWQLFKSRQGAYVCVTTYSPLIPSCHLELSLVPKHSRWYKSIKIMGLWISSYSSPFCVGFQCKVEVSSPLPLDLQIKELIFILLRTLLKRYGLLVGKGL